MSTHTSRPMSIHRFLIIATFLLVAFGESFRFLFKHSPLLIAADYSSFSRSLSTSFRILLEGGTSLEAYLHDGHSDEVPLDNHGITFAWILMAVMLVCIVLLLVNLLIAMFAKTFDRAIFPQKMWLPTNLLSLLGPSQATMTVFCNKDCSCDVVNDFLQSDIFYSAMCFFYNICNRDAYTVLKETTDG